MTGTTAPAPQHVVVGVDGSEAAVRAAVYAAEQAQRRGVRLQIVHVTPADDGADESATRLVEAAADAARQATGLTDVSTAVVDDHPVDGLVALSAEAALLVVGTRGMGGVAGLFLGSTAGSVVQHARCPVIALPDEGEYDVEHRSSVVAGIEGGPGDEQVLAFAVAEAAARGTEVIAVHAWRELIPATSLGGFEPMIDWSSVEAQERQLLTDAVAPWHAERPEVQIHEELVRERAANALVAAASTAELLVVGHRHRGVLARLGSSTHGVLHRAACPVAVVPLPR